MISILYSIVYSLSFLTFSAVKRRKYKHCNTTINRLKQSSSQRNMSSLGAFAVLSSRDFNYFIKKTEVHMSSQRCYKAIAIYCFLHYVKPLKFVFQVTIGRSTDDTDVDIDLRKESHANMISRQQVTMFKILSRVACFKASQTSITESFITNVNIFI